jgi:hypothetical protein
VKCVVILSVHEPSGEHSGKMTAKLGFACELHDMHETGSSGSPVGVTSLATFESDR